jgi:hypothetical protein
MRIWISGWLLAIALSAALSGCSSSPPPDDSKDRPPQPTVFDDTIRTEERAKEAAAKVENRVNDLNRQLTPQENGDAAPQESTPADESR